MDQLSIHHATTELLVAHRCAPLASRVVYLPLEDIPHALAPHWFGAPATWFDFHLAVFDTEAPVRRPDDVTFLRLGPTSEIHSTVAAYCRTLTRSPAPAAQPIREDLPLPGFTYPSHVASLHLPCASTPYSLHELPGVLSTRCAHGTDPSELDLARIAVVSRLGIPSCDWRNASRVKADFSAY
jgi:hypothetical protein